MKTYNIFYNPVLYKFIGDTGTRSKDIECTYINAANEDEAETKFHHGNCGIVLRVELS